VAIETWFRTRATSPLTNVRVDRALLPSHNIKALAEEHRADSAPNHPRATRLPDRPFSLIARYYWGGEA